MKKSTVFLILIFLMFSSFGCTLNDLIAKDQPETDSTDQPPSSFEIWSRGINTSIKIGDGQENLENFREHISIEMTGIDESGDPFHSSQESLREVDRDTDSSREIETLETPSKYLSGTREWVEMEGYSYFVQELNQRGRVCEKEEIPEDTSHFADEHVTRVLVSITPGDLLEKDQLVNGVLVDVYEIEDLSMLFAREINTVSGKVWISQEPNYFVMAEGRIEGVMEFENRFYTGEAVFQFEVNDYNQVQVQLPALCAYPPEDMLPIPDQAFDINDFGGLITFSSEDTADQILSYYLTELEAGGWQLEEKSSDMSEQTLQASLDTSQGIRITAEIKIIKMGDDSTMVQLKWVASE